MRLRFSLRTLFLGLTAFGVVLGLALRFGPHVLWKTLHSRIASGAVPIPSKPLKTDPPNEDLVVCHIGPVSFELPRSMSADIKVHLGASALFSDGHRTLVFRSLDADDGGFQRVTSCPDASLMALTLPRLYKELCDAKSSDFSFAMSPQELRRHEWLLKERAWVLSDVDSVEWLWRPDLEGYLVFHGGFPVFQWATTERRWDGQLDFEDPSPETAVWIRHACATLQVNGDLAVLQDWDEATFKSMVKIVERNKAQNRQIEP